MTDTQQFAAKLLRRSIFYFCCDFPIDTNWSTKNIPTLKQPEDDFSWELPVARKRSNNGSKTPNISSRKSRSAKQKDKDAQNTTSTSAHKLSDSSLSSEKTKKKRKSTSKKSSRANSGEQSNRLKADERLDENREDSPNMKKCVTFADNVEDNSCDDLQSLNLENRRSSLPPPPPKFLGSSESKVASRKKRRDSVSISISTAPATQKKERLDKEKPKDVVIKPYEMPKWTSIKVTVTFKDESFSTEFLEYQTLEDLYSWLRKQLLMSDIFTPGADLLLFHDNLKFPLKASTASNTIASLPHYILKCEEITNSGKNGGFGDTNSRFDTRFSLPLDIRNLEGLSPVQYLSKHCIVSNSWKAFYHNTFIQNDKDRDGLMSYKELKGAMERLFVELAHPLLKRVLFLLGYDPLSKLASSADFNQDKTLNWRFQQDAENTELTSWQEELSINKDAFVSICALANRIICRENTIDGYLVGTVKQSGTQLEDADFYNIEGKLRDFELNPLTKLLLLYVKK